MNMPLNSVLIVDDNEADRYLLSRLIRRAKISDQIFEANDGLEGLDFFRNHQANAEKYGDDFPPLLVFLDINMPRVNGFEFLEAFAGLREEHGYDAVVLVMFTSSQLDEERDRASQFEFVKGFITKMPLDAAQLRSQLDEAGVALG